MTALYAPDSDAVVIRVCPRPNGFIYTSRPHTHCLVFTPTGHISQTHLSTTWVINTICVGDHLHLFHAILALNSWVSLSRGPNHDYFWSEMGRSRIHRAQTTHRYVHRHNSVPGSGYTLFAFGSDTLGTRLLLFQ